VRCLREVSGLPDTAPLMNDLRRPEALSEARVARDPRCQWTERRRLRYRDGEESGYDKVCR
jgi:hypothetical protein